MVNTGTRFRKADILASGARFSRVRMTNEFDTHHAAEASRPDCAVSRSSVLPIARARYALRCVTCGVRVRFRIAAMKKSRQARNAVQVTMPIA